MKLKIRVVRDGDGHRYEIRDEKRRLIREGWGAGTRQAALDDARRIVQQLSTN